MFDVGVIIVSDRASSGEREDGCLPVFDEVCDGTDLHIVDRRIVSDDPDRIKEAIESLQKAGRALILTSGGTGCSDRDNTPEVSRQIIEKFTPGIDEAIRSFSARQAPFAIFSRGVSGIVGRSLLINLPGSPKAVREVMQFLLPIINHPLKLLANQINDCQEEIKLHDRT